MAADGQTIQPNSNKEQQPELLGPAFLFLRSVRREHRSVGYIEAEPRVKIGEVDLGAQALSEQISAQRKYLTLPQGKVAIDALRQAGLAGFGRAIDGTSLAPFPLGPEAVLWHDFTQIPGPWHRTEPLMLTPPASGTRSQSVYNHLEWLRTWGFSGGIQGTLTQVGATLIRWLKNYLDRVQQAKVLVVGTTTVQNYMFRLAAGEQVCRFSGSKQVRAGKLNFITPEQLEDAPLLAQMNEWDIICLINVNMFLDTKHAKLLDVLHTLPRALFLGLFNDVSFKEKEEAREHCTRLLGLGVIGSTHLVWRYLLRNPREPVRELPQAPATGAEATSSIPQGSLGLAPYSFELRSFLGNAERFSNIAGKAVPFCTYYNQRPSYGNMDKRQLAWYLYWRDEVRQGRYPETGLDYIRLLALELINGYGVPDLLVGYEQLNQLWLNYREQYQSLDNWLPEWLCDYLLVNGSPLDPIVPLQQAVKLGVPTRYPDMLLESFQRQGWREVPFSLLEQMAHTRLKESPVYTATDRAKIADVVLRALANIDDIWAKEDGRGIVERLRPRHALTSKRLPFANVLFARGTRLLFFSRFYPYSQHLPFLSMLQSLIKQTENVLRIERGYRGRVRSPNLPGLLPTFVEQSFQQAKPRSKVTIDTERVAILTQQSDEVRDLLLAEADGGQVGLDFSESQGGSGEHETKRVAEAPRACDIGKIGSSRQGPKEVTPCNKLVDCLGELERWALALLLLPEGWQQFVQECQVKAIMPELVIDNINDCALEAINDLLIDTATSNPTIREEYLLEVEVMLNELRA